MNSPDFDNEKMLSRISELENLLCRKTEENEKLRQSLDKQTEKSISAARKLYALSETKSSRLQYFLTRFKRQLLGGNKAERTAFRKWLFSEKIVSNADRMFSPLVDVICDLQGVANPAAYSEDFSVFKNSSRIDIITTKHTLFVAGLLQDSLRKCGVSCEIHVGNFEEFESIPYIIICPQFLKKFPPLYVVLQMEQTVSSRWLTDQYISILENAYAVLDYSLANIEYFSGNKKISGKIYYLPVTPCFEHDDDQPPEENRYEYDVLFYGDDSAERRVSFLNEIKKKYHVKIINNLFGDELYKELKKARIVINVHYYENALVETTRLSEVLSVANCVVVSEASENTTDENYFADMVDFIPIGDTQGMIGRIDYWLANEDKRLEKILENRQRIRKSHITDFYLERFLLANDVIPFDLFYRNVSDAVSLKSSRICLSLPESIGRRTAFLNENAVKAELFHGLKHRIGWIGCALSYKFIARKALEQGMQEVLICEDDVFFAPDFEERFRKIQEYLRTHKNWDVYSGVMADVTEEFKVLQSEVHDGEQYVLLNRLVSTVLNIFNHKTMEIISRWDESDRDAQTNAIDRYLESYNLRVLTNCPFLVGHKEDFTSAIWGFDNSQYSEMISRSSECLQKLVNR